MRIYLLDANMLITLSKGYYHFGRVPEFWTWLEDMATQGRIRIPSEIFDEVAPPKQRPKDRDQVSQWLIDRKHIFLLDEYDRSLLPRVIDRYRQQKRGSQWQLGDPLSAREHREIGQDPFLMCAALSGGADYVVVTMESSKPGKERANRKIPDVCKELGITCMGAVEFVHEADFKTSWYE